MTAATSWAQMTAVTTDQAPPIPGAGHDYINFLDETVNPSSGSVSIRIQVPIPADRSLNLPFAFGYDSNAAHHFSVCFSCNGPWGDNASYLSQGGWSYELPSLGFNLSTSVAGLETTGGGGNNIQACSVFSNYVFSDKNGTPHQPRIALTPPSSCGFNPAWPEQVLTDGDGAITATTTVPSTWQIGQEPPPLTATDIDGTIYYFSNTTTHIAGTDSGRDTGGFTLAVGPNTTLPAFVEDRNGNKVVITDGGKGNISVTDDIGRTVLKTSGFGVTGNTVTVSGLSTPYSTTWTSEPFSFNMTTTTLAPSVITSLSTASETCGTGTNSSVVGTGTYSGSQPELTSLALPNGQSYTFQYDSVYGELSKIIYPTGAYVRYEWELTPTYSATSLWAPWSTGELGGVPFDATCETLLPSPVVQHRFVSFDGVHEVLQQDFSYSTSFVQTAPNGVLGPFQAWTYKQTIVTTTDLLRGTAYTTTYNYQASTVPGLVNAYSPESFTGVYDTLPVETNVQTTDLNGNLISFVNESYSNVYLPPTDRKTTSTSSAGTSGMTSEVQTNYPSLLYPMRLMPVTDTYTYDFGASAAITTQSGEFGTLPQPTASGSLLRHTHVDYTSFPTTPVGGTIADRPTDVITYNGTGARIAETDYVYDNASLKSVTADAHDETNFSISYVQRGNATAITQQCFANSQTCTNPVTNYTYYQTGQPYIMTDPRGNSTQYSFLDSFTGAGSSTNTNGYLTQITYPSANGVNHIESFSYYYAGGQLSASKDENSQLTTYSYSDPWGRLTNTTYPDTGQTKITYNDSIPSVTTSKLMNTPNVWETSVSTMDGFGHVTETQLTTDPEGTDSVINTYDGEGRIFTKSNPYRSGSLSTVTYYYDALGRKTEESEQDGSIRQWCYNGTPSMPAVTNCGTHLGSLSTGSWVDSTDEAGNHWQRTTDAMGRLVDVLEPNGTSTSPSMETDYTYDGLNNLLSVVQWGGLNGHPAANGPIDRSFGYDSLSRLIQSFNPETGWLCYGTTGGAFPNGSNCTTSGYDTNSNLVYKTDARGITVTNGYDALNRLTSKQATGINYTYNYDSSTVGTGGAFHATNSIGRLVEAANGSNASEQFSYDPMGRVILQANTLPDDCCTAASQTGDAISASYDLAGDLTSLTYPDGRVVKESWDAAGHLNPSGSNQYAVWFDNYLGTSVNYPYLTSASYFPNGTPQSMTLGNGVVESYSSNSRQQLTEITLQATGSGLNQKLFDKFYCYGPTTTYGCPVFGTGLDNGNVWAIGDNVNGPNSLNTSYDTLNRIIHFTNGSGTMVQTYTYDPYGNMSQVSPGTLQSNLSFNANNQINSTGLSYDASGNLTKVNIIGGLNNYFGYDAESKLIDFNIGAETYTYDALGNRIQKSNGANWTEYVYFNGQPLAEKNSNGSWSDYIFANGQRISRADTFDARIYTSGTTPGGALASWQIGGGGGYVIQNGDILCLRQFQVSAYGGPNIQFTDGSQTYGNLDDSAGQPISAFTTEGQWIYRTANLSAFAGKTVSDYQVVTDSTSPAGSYGIYYGDIAIVSTNGTVTSIYDGQQGATFPLAYNYNNEQTNLSAVEQSSDLTGDAEQPMNVTAYYHGDHLGSARLVTAAGGWPISSDTFYPFGQEQAPPPDPNHYKFTGKERDSESGNDYFGARYYASSMGRWTSPDPAGIGFANAENPQSLNLYGYVQNNPLAFVDPNGLLSCPDGKWQDVACAVQTIGSAIGKFFSGLGDNSSVTTSSTYSTVDPGGGGSGPAPSSFQQLWHNYPTASAYPTFPKAGQTGIWDHVGGKVGQNGNSGVFPNSCSIRMCQALNASGFKIPYAAGKTSSDAMHNWNFPRLTDLQPFLMQNFGKPTGYPANNWRGQLAGQTGILFFEYSGAGWSGHVELWNGSSLRNPEEDYSGVSKGVLFWPVQ